MKFLMEFARLWLPSLLLTCTSAYVIIAGARENTSEDTPLTVQPMAMPEMQLQGKRTVWIGTIMLSLLIGATAGYASRDHQLVGNRFTYTDVAVLKRISDMEFVLWPDRMKQQHVQLCPESSVDWREGELLDDWTFEQRNGCKRVIAYHEKPKGALDAAIQVR